MGRQDRRERTALDGAYRYYKELESGETEPDIFRLNQAVKTLSVALAVADVAEFKLTRQLWKRLHEALFDKLITNFAGRISVLDENRLACEIRNPLPERGYLQFYADRCKRSDDKVEIELAKLYPRTYNAIQNVWLRRGAFTKPSDFEGSECQGGVCFATPLVVGQEVLSAESTRGHEEAHQKWWELYWQVYCSPARQEQIALTRKMHELESIWGNLYY
jgi:hypothetical protein